MASGLTDFIDRKVQSDGMDILIDSDDLVHAVFMCCDLPYQYLEKYEEVLGSYIFTPIAG